MNTDPSIEAYVGSIRTHLRSATASEEERVVLAVTACILVRAAEPGMTIESAIAKLGPAKKLAIQYRDAHLIEKAGKSWSPALLLQASLRNGIPGMLAFVVGLALYWVGGFAVVFGTLSLLLSLVHFSPHGKIAIGGSLADLIVPIVVGLVVLVVTTLLLRAMLRVSKRSTVSQ